MKSPGVPSLISTDVVLEGNLVSTGEVQFDGNITGNIRAASLIIGEKATVKGEVACEAVTVRGRVVGMVRARNVALASTAHIEGDIMHSSLSVEPGAHFDGNCRHSDDPLSDDAARAFDRPAGTNPSAPRPAPSAPSGSTAETTTMAPAPVAHAQPQTAVPSLDEALVRPTARATGLGDHNGPGFPPRAASNGDAAGQGGASSFMVKNRSPLR
ncbi:MAG: polymer-forming cytoskeletal protein [Pseudomonadota bacterium]